MRRPFLIALGAGIVVLAILVLAIGAFPPHPHQHSVEKTVPATTFAAH